LAARTAPRFRDALAHAGIGFDDAQRHAIDRLSGPTDCGYYLHGTTGRGKTALATLYFDAIPTQHKTRVHFHDFLAGVQSHIAHSGRSHSEAIRSVIGPTDAVFFDEFHVHDVADAIYLTEMLGNLCNGRTLVIATSNYSPADLMPNPLFHSRFAPAITIITGSMTVVDIAGGPDYRTLAGPPERGFGSGSWICGPPENTGTPATPVPLCAGGIKLMALRVTGRAAHLTFAELCERPVGSHQYLWLADSFESITITGVPDLASAERDPLMRLANLVDILHDRNIRLDVHSAGPPGRILDAPAPPPDVARTLSRLGSLRTPTPGAGRTRAAPGAGGGTT